MIYLDYAAAAPVEPETLEYWQRCFLDGAGVNPESAHACGRDAGRRAAEAAERLAELFFPGRRYRVLWGRCATELFHFIGAAVTAGKTVVSSKLEHPALLAALNRSAAGVETLRIDRCGKPALTGNRTTTRAACSILHQVQSETGLMPDLDAAFALTPDALTIVDAVQAAGKMPLYAADAVVISGSKFGAPGGAALLYNPGRRELKDLEQRYQRYRHEEYLCGRLVPAEALTLLFAAETAVRRLPATSETVRSVNAALRTGLIRLGAEPTIEPEHASAWICHVRLPGKQGAVAARWFSEQGIMLSSSSACAAEIDRPSPALLALGFSREEAYQGLRISPGAGTTSAHVDTFLSVMETIFREY